MAKSLCHGGTVFVISETTVVHKYTTTWTTSPSLTNRKTEFLRITFIISALSLAIPTIITSPPSTQDEKNFLFMRPKVFCSEPGVPPPEKAHVGVIEISPKRNEKRDPVLWKSNNKGSSDASSKRPMLLPRVRKHPL